MSIKLVAAVNLDLRTALTMESKSVMQALLLLFILGTNAESPDSSTSPPRALGPVTTTANAVLAPGIHPVKYTLPILSSVQA